MCPDVPSAQSQRISVEASRPCVTSASPVGVLFDATLLATASTDGSGLFAKVGIEIPSSTLPGPHVISAQQSSSGDSAQANFNVNMNRGQFHLTITMTDGIGMRTSFPSGLPCVDEKPSIQALERA
jgi:hypothetical protein